MITLTQLTGQSDELITVDTTPSIHRDVVEPWQEIVEQAGREGIALASASAYRNFSRQLTIWNEKATGVRQLYDRQGRVLDATLMSERDLLFAILHWSAVPGASRHHWGTEIDVYDRNAIAAGDSFSLQPHEYSEQGCFCRLAAWLDVSLSKGDSSAGFFRPYNGTTGVAPEPWHLSYKPVAKRFEAMQTKETLYEFYRQRDELCLLDVLLLHFDEVYDSYIVVAS